MGIKAIKHVFIKHYYVITASGYTDFIEEVEFELGPEGRVGCGTAALVPRAW